MEGRPSRGSTRGGLSSICAKQARSAHGYTPTEPRCPASEEAVRRAREWSGLDGIDCASQVAAKEAYQWSSEGDRHVVVLDCGVKYNILRQLAANGFRVTVLPVGATPGEILARRPDGLLLSNGPGDPGGVKGAVECVRELLGKVPIMGICLGHQILGLACGARTGRLPFGHHGCNHPVKDLASGCVEITSQNHNFAILPDGLPECLEVTHVNLNDRTIEGVRHKNAPAFSVQYHPEAAPGPFDSRHLFGRLRELMSL